jgi:hypothetical protein
VALPGTVVDWIRLNVILTLFGAEGKESICVVRVKVTKIVNSTPKLRW